MGLDSIEFKWSTSYPHTDNEHTLREYLDKFLPNGSEITYKESNWAEVKFEDIKYVITARGDGDSFSHIIEWHIM